MIMASTEMVCRLCSSTNQIVNVFNEKLESGDQLRLYILLATGIHIKETDIVSKMVCHRCCAIAVKLHKYRTNAVANDKRLQLRAHQPYTAPITDQEELFRDAAKICSNNSEALELITLAIKPEPPDTDDTASSIPPTSNGVLPNQTLLNSVSNEHPSVMSITNGSCDQPVLNFTCDSRPSVSPTSNQSLNSSRNEQPSPVTNLTPKSFSSYQQYNKDTSPKVQESKKTSSVIPNSQPTSCNNGNLAAELKKIQHLLRKPCNIEVKRNAPEQLPLLYQKVKCLHPSVKNIITKYRNILFPVQICKEDLAPVIPLDSSEVTDWYKEYYKKLKNKKPISQIVLQKLPDSSHYKVSASSKLQAPSIFLANKNVVPNDTVTACNTAINNTTINNNEHQKLSYQRILNNTDDDSDSTILDQQEYSQYSGPSVTSDPVAPATVELPNAIVANVPNKTCILPPPVHKQIHRAIKRTARKPNCRKRKSSLDNDTSEVIPEKKKRIFYNKNAMSTVNKVDLPRECPADKTEQKAIFTSSLELTPIEPLPDLIDCQNILTTGKTLQVYMCSVCSLPCDSKKQLTEHEKIHLTCKFCKEKIKNVELMKQHLSNSCYISLVKDNALIRLTRVDEQPSVVKQYPEAFQAPSVNLLCNEMIEFSDFGISMEGTETPVVYDAIPESTESLAAGQRVVPEQTVSAHDNSMNTTALNTTSESRSNNVEVVCISDDSDDELQCSVPRRLNVIQQVEPKPQTLESIISPFQKNLTEKEMIRSLFKKYSSNTEKCNNSCQTFIPRNDSIKYTNTNLIILENMFTELLAYKIPVQLEAQPQISARFQSENNFPEKQPSTLECWVHKTPIGVQKVSSKYTSATNVSNNASVRSSLNNSNKGIALPAVIPKTTVNIPTTTATSTYSGRNIPPSTANTRQVPSSYPNRIAVTNSSNIAVATINPTTVTSATCNIPRPPNKFSLLKNTTRVITSNSTTPSSFAKDRSTVISTGSSTFRNNLQTAQNSVIVPIVSTVSHSSPSSNQPANYMQIVESGNATMVPMQYQIPIVSQNNVNTSYGIAAQPSSLMQIVDMPTATVNHYPTTTLISQPSATVVNTPPNQIYQIPETAPVYHINNHITNLNKVILLQQPQHQPQPARSLYETSFSNNLYNHPPPSYQQSVQIREIEKANQSDLVTSSSYVPPVTQSLIRVKNMNELTNKRMN